MLLEGCGLLAEVTKKLKFYLKGRHRAVENGLATRVDAAYSCRQTETESMSDGVNRLLGDTPGRTIVKLIVVSLIVGFVMAIFGVDPWDIVYGIRNFVLDLWYQGFHALGRVGDYLILGATIVIPAFIILRLLSYRR
ncbi:hypothetical protein RHAB21_03030 [Pseudorhizobium halotolerans]|nr:integrase [Rhizobium sp. Khangiran2]CAD7040301.1 hypothetical protein RHAB21_03030 [Pseudorhizobium halotolerans]